MKKSENYVQKEKIDEITKKKCTKDTYLILCCRFYHMFIYSINEGKIIYEFDKSFIAVNHFIADNEIEGITNISNKDTFFIRKNNKLFQWRLNTRKCVSKYEDLRCDYIKRTYIAVNSLSKNGRYLISRGIKEVNIRSARNLKLIKNFYFDLSVSSLECSHDNKLLFIGFKNGMLIIIDLQTFGIIKKIQLYEDVIGGNFNLSDAIYCIAEFKKDKSLIVMTSLGYAKRIDFVSDYNCLDHFEVIRNYGAMTGGVDSRFMCLTGDEKNIIVGSDLFLRVINSETGLIVKKIKFKHEIKGIELFDDGKKVIIATSNGLMTIIDLDSMEVSEERKNIGKDNQISYIIKFIK